MPFLGLAISLGSLLIHYTDVIMNTMASQITSLTVVYSIVYSDADQRKHQSSASLAFVWGIHPDRWIPRTKGQLRGKCFHLMTSSCSVGCPGHKSCQCHDRLIQNRVWCHAVDKRTQLGYALPTLQSCLLTRRDNNYLWIDEVTVKFPR